MHLARRGYVLVLLTAVLAVVAVWSDDRQLRWWWQLPAVALLLGLAAESVWAQRRQPVAALAIAPRAYLGRALEAAFTFANGARRPLTLEYARRASRRARTCAASWLLRGAALRTNSRCYRCASARSPGRRCPREFSGRSRSPGGRAACRSRRRSWWRPMRCAARCARAAWPPVRVRGG